MRVSATALGIVYGMVIGMAWYMVWFMAWIMAWHGSIACGGAHLDAAPCHGFQNFHNCSETTNLVLSNTCFHGPTLQLQTFNSVTGPDEKARRNARSD